MQAPSANQNNKTGGISIDVAGESRKGALYRTWRGLALDSKPITITNTSNSPAQMVVSTSGNPLTPEPAVRFAGGRSTERSNAGENPWPGLAVDYYLKEKPQGDVTLAFLDSAGTVIRTFSSKTDTTKRAAVEDSVSYAPSDSIVSVRAGTNRFVWNLRSPDADKVKDVVVDEGMVEGPVALPGRYTVKLTVAGKSYSQPFTIVEDPRITVPPADLAANHTLALRIHDRIDTLSAAVTRIEQDRKQLTDWVEWTKQQPYATRVKGAADSLKAKLEAVRDKLTEPHAHADEATLHWPIQIYNQLLSLNAMVQSADAAPTRQEQQAAGWTSSSRSSRRSKAPMLRPSTSCSAA